VFQRDYILRLVEQLAKTLGAVLALKKAKRFDEAELTVAEAAKNLVGLDVDTLLALPVDQIVTLFSPSGSLDAGKCLVVAELLCEHGDIKALRDDEETAYLARIRALSLLLEVSVRESLERVPDPQHYIERIDTLTETLSVYPSVPTVQKKLMLHHERQGDYAAAEDVLFELVDAGHDDVISAGIELYRRLLKKSDDDLEKGKLPREEVRESLSQLEAHPSK